MPMQPISQKFAKVGTEVVYMPRSASSLDSFFEGVITKVSNTRVTVEFKAPGANGARMFTEQFKASTNRYQLDEYMPQYGSDTYRSSGIRLKGDPYIEGAKRNFIKRQMTEEIRHEAGRFPAEIRPETARALAAKLEKFAADMEAMAAEEAEWLKAVQGA